MTYIASAIPPSVPTALTGPFLMASHTGLSATYAVPSKTLKKYRTKRAVLSQKSSFDAMSKSGTAEVADAWWCATSAACAASVATSVVMSASATAGPSATAELSLP
eukprot:CAMPEP_0206123778 /NCGR_PEP_ID=MMETSP1472-20131121/6501_1 /ASSEMBLY_ACC=CAM_ASM_001108 /TAXON_ID=41880 /ORGANISM="Pycnococcus provasolii, Strain RCC251" /LENGTH=105 /DNA_ID=CAMNT_0053514429 /DNA_START=29 /DNA_END=346 /DNA_ORIENTATION=-